MIVKFWGVRGSIPSPGPSTAHYGGNTSCVSIQFGAERTLVLDAGTGIRELGKALKAVPGEIFVLLSHIHWDHVQGFPFFLPLYLTEHPIFMFPGRQGPPVLWSLIEQMDGAHFPVTPDRLPARLTHVTDDAMSFLRAHGIAIERIETNHPGGGYGYRIVDDGRSVVYLTDNELDPPYAKATSFDDFARFCRRADVLIHDAQYVEEDMPHKHGWGHSLVRQACELAVASEVKHLVLFHHDPERTDQELDSIEGAARDWIRRKNPSMTCTAAFEGLALSV
jgi:phosphoribosyl 1,2-cyclic phosphodiesterase